MKYFAISASILPAPMPHNGVTIKTVNVIRAVLTLASANITVFPNAGHVRAVVLTAIATRPVFALPVALPAVRAGVWMIAIGQ